MDTEYQQYVQEYFASRSSTNRLTWLQATRHRPSDREEPIALATDWVLRLGMQPTIETVTRMLGYMDGKPTGAAMDYMDRFWKQWLGVHELRSISSCAESWKRLSPWAKGQMKKTKLNLDLEKTVKWLRPCMYSEWRDRPVWTYHGYFALFADPPEELAHKSERNDTLDWYSVLTPVVDCHDATWLYPTGFTYAGPRWQSMQFVDCEGQVHARINLSHVQWLHQRYPNLRLRGARATYGGQALEWHKFSGGQVFGLAVYDGAELVGVVMPLASELAECPLQVARWQWAYGPDMEKSFLRA